jgi:hypothetical protein
MTNNLSAGKKEIDTELFADGSIFFTRKQN